MANRNDHAYISLPSRLKLMVCRAVPLLLCKWRQRCLQKMSADRGSA